MERLPLSQKAAYIKVYVNSIGIYACLRYSHDEIERTYYLKDFTAVNNDFWKTDKVEQIQFWKEYFEGLEEKFTWKFISNEFSIKIFPFIDEEQGIDSIEVAIDEGIADADKVLASLRDYCMDLRVLVSSEIEEKRFFSDIAKRSQYQEILLLDLNLRDIKVTRFTLDQSKENLSDLQSGYKIVTSQRKLSSLDELITIGFDNKIKAFLLREDNSDKFKNRWANFLLSEQLHTSSSVIIDRLRAFVTIQLLSMFGGDNRISAGFGIQAESRVKKLDGFGIIITGELAKLLPSRDLLISVIDGLQLHGHFDLISDTDRLLKLFHKYINFPNNVCSVDKVILIELPKRTKEKSVVINGTLSNINAGQSKFYCLSNDFTAMAVPKDKTIYEIETIKDAHLLEVGQKFDILSNPEKINYRNIIIDTRQRPIVYGPDARSNKLKFEKWFSE